MILNTQNLQILFTGFQAAYGEAFAKFGTQATWDKIAMLTQSSTSKEVYAWLGQTTGFREWVGERVKQSLELHDFTIKNRRWENTVVMNADMVDDDEYGVLMPLIQQLGQDAALHPDMLVFQLLASGMNSICYDGQNFFDTDHPVGPQGNQLSVANKTTGANAYTWYLLDTQKAIKPIIYQKRRDYRFIPRFDPNSDNVYNMNEFEYGVDGRSNVGFGMWQLAHASTLPLNTANFGAVKASMTSIKKDNGQPMGITPSILLVPPEGEADALETIKVERLANGASNPFFNVVQVMVSPWLA